MPKYAYISLYTDLDLFCPWRRSIGLASPIGLLDLPLDVLRLRVRRPRDDPRVREARLQQVGEDEDEEDTADHGDHRRDTFCEERTVEGEEEAGGADDEEEGDIEDAGLRL